jgi:hypothetical protein
MRGGTPRFMSLRFEPRDDLVRATYDFRDEWSFEVDCKPSDGRNLRFAFELVANAEIPNFELRRNFFPEEYL